MAAITPDLVQGLEPTGPSDPIVQYRRPLVGLVYRERINRGLRLLPRGPLGAVLEVGYGSGTVLLALREQASELHGIDLDAAPAEVSAMLASRGASAELAQGSVLELPYPAARFDLVVSFSTFEHVRDYRQALGEVARVLRPGGHFLLGMPAVNRMMGVAFRLIGFHGIDEHHVTTPEEVSRAFEAAGLQVERRHHLDLPLPRPLGLRVYYDWLLRK